MFRLAAPLFWFSFFALLLSPKRSDTHPFYVSVTELHFYAEHAELTIRIFTDDFESALRMQPGGRAVDLIKRSPAQVDSLVAQYLREHIQIQLNHQAFSFNYIGYEIKEDACWAYFEAPLKHKAGRVRIENTLLLEVLPTQQNIVHVVQGTYRRTRKLNGGNVYMELNELR
ncbi:MAG: DUF6702 family protein [Bacteroidia bacterium]